MKVAVALALLGVAALVGLSLPVAPGMPAWLSVAWDAQAIHAVLLVLGASTPIAVGAWAALRRPLLRWHAIAATAGFGVVFLKVQVYRGLTHVLGAPLSMQILTASVLVGLATAIAAIIVAPDA